MGIHHVSLCNKYVVECLFCKKVITNRSDKALYCSSSCKEKAKYHRNRDYYREKDRISVSKHKIGLNIRDETLNTPTQDAKWLWHGIGAWSRKYWPEIQECLECRTTVYKHKSGGICAKCYDILRPRTDEQKSQYKRTSYLKAKSRGYKTSQQVAREWVKKAKEETIPVTTTIQNLLDNHEKLKVTKKK